MPVARNTLPIVQDGIYHIYNRAIGNEKLFSSKTDYRKFLDYIKEFVLPHVSVYAYCLLPNHFHFLLQVNSIAMKFSKSMSDACNKYAKNSNTKYNRRGGLFIRPFKRKLIEDDAALAWITWYIHHNPLHHGLTKDWQNWPWSSYKAYTNNYSTVLEPNS